MNIIGYFLVLVGLFFLYGNELVIGGLGFSIGGFLAKKLSISIRSAGVMLMVVPIAYGYHYEYEPIVIVLIVVGFVLANVNSKGTFERNEWGFDIDFSSIGSDGDNADGGGGD